MNAERLKRAAIAGFLCSLIAPAMLQADATSANVSIAKFVSNMKIGGDMRLRQESFWKTSPGQRDRSRQRFRFRLGVENTIQDVKMAFKLASGTGEQVSTNQTFDNLNSQKSIFIDQAYLSWKAREWLTLSGGRMKNPFWRVTSSDLMWDDDVNPEGFAEQFKLALNERLGLFANFAQMPLDEDSSDNRDQWMFGHQLGANVKVSQQSKWNVAATLYHFKYENLNNFGAAANQEGNTRKTAGSGSSAQTDVLAASFTIVQLTQEFSTKLGSLPFKVHADYVKNVQSNGALGAAVSDQQSGYQVGAILGKAGSAKTWEAAYFYKWLETNAAIADLSDSDFGDGGTNRRGHIFWLAFNPRDYVQVKAKYFNTKVLRTNIPPGADNINRLQVDVSVKF